MERCSPYNGRPSSSEVAWQSKEVSCEYHLLHNSLQHTNRLLLENYRSTSFVRTSQTSSKEANLRKMELRKAANPTGLGHANHYIINQTTARSPTNLASLVVIHRVAGRTSLKDE